MENQEHIQNNTKEFTEKKAPEKIREITNEKLDKKTITIEMRLLGWVGSILIITAYTLNSLGYLDSQDLRYPILNLAGSFFMGIRIWAARNWSNFFLEIFWAAIAVVSIIKWFIG